MTAILNRLARLWSSRPSLRMQQPTGRSSKSRFLPRLEQLEDRSVPAGFVNATFAAGTLTLTALNDLTGVPGLNHQNITLDGGGGNSITVTANDGETGTAIGQTFNGVTRVRLNMGLGDDTVLLTDAVLTGNVTCLGGSGNNTLNINNSGGGTGVTIGSLTVANGDGFDTLFFGAGNHTVNGNTIVNNGQGGSDTSFGRFNAGDSVNQFKGVTRITNLDGFDHFEVRSTDTTFTGAVTIRNGNGDSDTYIESTGNSNFTGGLAVSNGTGHDQFVTAGNAFTVGTPTARRNLVISNSGGEGGGNPSSTIFVAATNTINGNLSIAAAAGNDNLQVDGNQFAVLGSVTVNVGTGGSRTSFSPSQIVDIDGAVTVRATQGDDTLDFEGATSVDLRNVTFSGGSGKSELQFKGAETTANNITSVHADGFNLFDVSGTDFTAGAIAIRNGHGGSQTRIDAANTNTVNGAISIVNGDGDDSFQTGGTAFTLGAGATGLLRRNLTINNGAGRGNTSFNAATDTMNGAISIVNGSGIDDWRVNSDTFLVTGPTGNVTINNGAGGGITVFRGGADGGNNHIGGRLTILGTDGSDNVQLQRGAGNGLTVVGATTINTGNGDDGILLEHSKLGVFRAVMGAGGDVVWIERLNDGGNSEIGAANINLGAGDDRLEIGTGFSEFANFTSAVVNGGLGLDLYLNGSSLNTGLPMVGPALPSFGFEQLT